MEYGQDITAIVGESARIDVGEALQYIKVGTDEIEAVAEQKITEYNTNANEKTNAFNSNATSKTNTYNTNAQEKIDAYNSNVSGKIEAFNDLATSKTSAFNTNATNKTDAFNAVAAEKTSDFNENAAAKTTAFNENSDNRYNTYNSNATEKLSAYNLNATEKLTAYNNNDSSKTAIYNTNAESKVNDYNSNATSKTNAFNSNASTKTTAFNNNATDKTNAFNDNATSKTSDFNTNAQQKLEQASTYANNSKIWAEGLDGEVTPLGGTHSSKGWAEIAEQAASGVQNPANRDLSNLTNTGQMIIDSVDGKISNCILEIPQNIKLTLENNVLTLKAGSIITQSGSTYSTLTIANDLSFSIPSTLSDGEYTFFCFNNGSAINYQKDGSMSSGATDSLEGTRWHVWFDTENKQIKRYTTDTTTPQAIYAYPLCRIEMSSDVASFAKDSNGNDMIFNGAGFIGYHAFVYPNIKALVPDGFNEDGSLKSSSATTSSLAIRAMGANQVYSGIDRVVATNAGWSGYTEVDKYSDADFSKLWMRYYVRQDNKIYVYTGSNVIQEGAIPLVFCYYNGTIVTKFDIRQPVRLATTEMLATKQADVTTLTGYDSTQTQTLKNINGVLQWVTD